MDSTLKRYSRRPVCLENICYADFASWYDLCPAQKKVKKDVSAENELPETEYEYDTTDDYLISEKHSQQKIHYRDGTVLRKWASQKVIYCHYTSLNEDREDYFRKMLMLYTCWRNEDEDLLGEEATYEQSYEKALAVISSKRMEYEKVDSALIDGLMSEHTDTHALTQVDIEGQHRDMIDLEEGALTSKEYGCFDPGITHESQDDQYDIGQDFGIKCRHVATDFVPHKEINNNKFLEMAAKFNQKQELFFNHILHWIKTKSDPLYIFLSGGAGVGKSILLKTLYQGVLKALNHRRSENPDSMKILLCAPTGKAAHNIGGSTIHSAFHIRASQGYNFKALDLQQLNTLRCRFHDLKMIFIDEISMVGRNLFNFINLRLQEVFSVSKPFGGVSVVAFGDLFQLKPVHDAWIFSQKYSQPTLQSLGCHLWLDLFSFYELTEVMRQKDDLKFALLLNRLREGNHTEEDVTVLESRLIKNLDISSDSVKHFPHLFSNKESALNHNELIFLGSDENQRVEIEAVDAVSGNLDRSLHDVILSHVSTDPNHTMGLHKLVKLAVGIPCELCVNVDTSDGLTNGAPCCVKKFDYRVSHSDRVSIVWVEFDDEAVGLAWRQKYKHLYTNDVQNRWIPVLETCRKFNIQYYQTYLVARRQFPLILSAAKTIHKSQGSTLSNAVLHFGHRKVSHSHYVGLYISELNEKKISVCEEVCDEMWRLRHEKKSSNVYF